MSKTSQLKLNYSKSINLLKVFNNDKNPKKINLFSNYLFDKKNNPFIFNSVINAKEYSSFRSNFNEYIPHFGNKEFLNQTNNLYFKNNQVNYKNIQTFGKINGLKITAEFLKKNYNHENLLISLPYKNYDYVERIFSSNEFTTTTYNTENIIESIKLLNDDTIILLSNNLDGYTIPINNWKEIFNLCKEKNLFIVFDFKMLGLNNDYITHETEALNLLNNMNYQSIILTSYSQTLTLFNDRIGNLFFCGNSKDETSNI